MKPTASNITNLFYNLFDASKSFTHESINGLHYCDEVRFRTIVFNEYDTIKDRIVLIAENLTGYEKAFFLRTLKEIDFLPFHKIFSINEENEEKIIDLINVLNKGQKINISEAKKSFESWDMFLENTASPLLIKFYTEIGAFKIQNDLISFIEKDYRKFILTLEKSIVNKPNELTNSTIKTSPYNTNHFNNDCHLLFEYLIDNYEKNGKVKFINIFYFLNKHVATVHQDVYRFSINQIEYKNLIQSKYGIEIKKFEHAKIEFEEKEVPKLKDLFKNFKAKLNRE